MTPNEARPPTIRHVAAQAGLSKSLVSLVLQGSPKVSEVSREAVMQAIKDLGYRPNAAARSLVQQRTRSIGVLFSNLRNPWHGDLLDGLNAVLDAHNMRPLLADANRSADRVDSLLQTFIELRVEGIILVGTMHADSAIADAAKRVPTLIVGAREPLIDGVDIFANDDVEGAKLATEHLISLGHRRIGHIAGHGVVGDLRRQSFDRTMHNAGLVPTDIEPSDMTEEGGYTAALRLLQSVEGTTALFAANDLSCVGAYSAAQELGLRVPHDLSLVGYDNTSLAKIRHLSLTSVDIAAEETGVKAAESMMAQIEGRASTLGVQLVSPTLIVRGTSVPPPVGV